MKKEMQEMKSDTADWQARAIVYELLALSFRYPDRAFVDILVSGEYAEAAAEVAAALEAGVGGVALDASGPDAAVEAGVADAALDASEPDSGAEKLKPEVSDGPSGALEPYKDADAEALLHTLRAEATRLFVGAPDPVVSPYEGVWRAGDNGVQALLFVNPHSMAVERFMKSCGVGQPQGKNEPLDHVATELEFLMYLSLLEAGLSEPPEGIEPPEDTEAPEDGWAAAYDSFLEEHARTWMSCFAQKVADETREPFYRVAADLLAKVVFRQI